MLIINPSRLLIKSQKEEPNLKKAWYIGHCSSPLDCDLGLVGLWVRELNDGILRIGALSNIGRGRMEVQQQKYELWRRANAPKLQGHAVLGDETDGNRPNDILSGLWKCHVITPEKLLELTDYLKEFTGGSIDVSLS